MPHPIENIMHSTMEEIKNIVDVNTIVGTPITAGGENIILPISKVSLGFLSGGGEYRIKNNEKSPIKKAGEALEMSDERYPFAGTAVAGMSLTPMGFLCVNNGNVKVLPAQFENTLDRAVALIPEALNIINGLINGKGGGSNA